MAIIVQPTMYKATYDNSWVDELEDAIIECRISMDTNREYTWEMNATITYEAWKKLQPYRDWVAPYLKVTFPDGTVRQGQLGLFLVLDSPETHTEYNSTVKLVAQDPLWLVDRQGFHARYSVAPGVKRTRAIKEILDTAVLTESPSGKRRYVIEDHEREFKKGYEWSRKVSKLDAINEILQGTAFHSLWTTKTGIMTTKRMGASRLDNMHPVRYYSANVPERFQLDRRNMPLGGLDSEVFGTINTTPHGLDMYNEILIVNDTPRGSVVKVRGHITAPNNPRGYYHSVIDNVGKPGGRRRIKRISNAVLEEDAVAIEVANALADQLSTQNSIIEMTVVPDPEPEFTRETIVSAIWKPDGTEVAFGKYAIHRIEYNMTADSASMVIQAGRVDSGRNYLITA